MKVLPRGKYVYCQLNRVEEKKTEGGIILPDKHSEGTRLAKVLAKGKNVDPDIEIDSVWAIQWHAGEPLHFTTLGILDDTLRLISESELMAEIKEDEDGDT